MVWFLLGIVLGFVLLMSAIGAVRLRSVYRGPSVSVTSSYEREEGILDATADEDRLVLFLRLVNERRGTVLLEEVTLLSSAQLEPIGAEDSEIEYEGTDTRDDGTEVHRYVYRRRDTELGGTFHAFDMQFEPRSEPFELTVRVQPEIPAKDLLVPWHEDRFELEPVERTFEVRP